MIDYKYICYIKSNTKQKKILKHALDCARKKKKKEAKTKKISRYKSDLKTNRVRENLWTNQ